MNTDAFVAYHVATANRLRAAEMFASLNASQWQSPSLCTGWTVREVAGHLVAPLEADIGWRGLVSAMIRFRGSLDRMVDAAAREAAARPTADLVDRLRELATVQLNPPVIGPAGPMVDSLIHLRDVARPLGLEVNPPPEDWRQVLDFIAVPTSATKNLVPKTRIAGLRLVTTDQDLHYGEGAEVRGPSEAIAMAITGRAVALDDLSGPGVAVLHSRIAPSWQQGRAADAG